MDKAGFESLAEEAFAGLPRELLDHVENVVFLVEDWPDEEILGELAVPHPAELLGLYDGSPLPLRTVDASGQLPDRVILYQKPIELHADEFGLPVAQVIRETLIHEIGHHFGLDDETLLLLEAADTEDENDP